MSFQMRFLIFFTMLYLIFKYEFSRYHLDECFQDFKALIFNVY
jgi:hypothetical protein